MTKHVDGQERLAKVDVLVRDEGTIIMLSPQTAEAQAWIDEKVQAESWQFLGKALCVDHRFADAILEGMELDGLIIEGEF